MTKNSFHSIQIFDGTEVEIDFARATSLSIVGGNLHRTCSACHQAKPATPANFPNNKNEKVKIGSTCNVCALARTRGYKDSKPVEYLRTIVKCGKVWTKNNPDRVQGYGAARLQREKAAGDDLTQHDREILILLANGLCQCCGKIPARIEFDHIRPLCLGGLNGIGNRQLLCRHCNAVKNIRCTDYRRLAVYEMNVADLAVAA